MKTDKTLGSRSMNQQQILSFGHDHEQQHYCCSNNSIATHRAAAATAAAAALCKHTDTIQVPGIMYQILEVHTRLWNHTWCQTKRKVKTEWHTIDKTKGLSEIWNVDLKYAGKYTISAATLSLIVCIYTYENRLLRSEPLGPVQTGYFEAKTKPKMI